MSKIESMKKYIFIIFVLVLSYWAVKSLFIPGFFPIHDDTQVSRIYEMSKALSDGMFPVRWVADLGFGYGYPIFNFYAPLSYYFGAAVTLIGADPLSSTKITFALGLLLAGVFMFLLGKSLWGNLGGIISAILYIYAPYSALNIYVRGDLAEVWGYAFVPLFFYGIINIYKSLKLKYVFISSLGLAAIILSHNLTAYMTAIFFVPTVIFFTFVSKNKIRFLVYSLASFILGSLLASFYFIPALAEMRFTNIFSQVGGGADFRDHFICLSQLWESNWGFGGSAVGCLDGMSFRIGKLHLIISFISLFIFFLKNEKLSKKFITFLGLSFLLSAFLMLPVSKFAWETVPLIEFLQYPWRFLIFASFFTSLLGGGTILLVRLLPQKIFRHGVLEYTILILFLAIFTYNKLFIPYTILPKTSSDYTETSVLNYKISKISDEYMPRDFSKPESPEQVPKEILVIAGDGEVQLLQKKTHEVEARVAVDSESIIHANIAYFPAWKVYIDGKETEINIKNNGFEFSVPKGESEINLVFSQTQLGRISNVLSIVALIILFAGIIFRKKLYES